MDPRLKTSFIPKKTFVAAPATVTASSSRVSVLTFVALLVFVFALALSAFVFLYQRKLVTEVEDKNKRLAAARSAFEPSLVKKLSLFSKQIEVSKELLSKHVAISPIFRLLSETTLKSVQFNDFTYGVKSNGEVEISMSGQAKGFESVALQSDIFAENDNIKNPVFDSLKIDQKGNVLFKFTASFSPEFVSYKRTLEE